MRLSPTLVALAIAAFPALAKAQSITWGSIPGEQILDSAGEKLKGDWQFELGVFLPGFFPTEANMADWVSNWLPIDKADYNEKIGYFASRAPAPEPEAAGLQAYIWVYNARKYDSQSEWLLITDRDGNHSNDWMIPNRSADPTAAVVDWRVSRATTFLMGSAERIASTSKPKTEEAKKVVKVSYKARRIPAATLVAAAAKESEAGEAPTAVAGEVAEEFTE